MQVKTFTGADNKEVLERIKAELGAEAVILDSKTVRENGRKAVRMTAALDRLDPDGGESPGGSSFLSPAAQWQREWSVIRRHMLALMKPALCLDLLEDRQRAALEYLEREGVGDQALLEIFRHLREKPGASVLAPLAGLTPVKPWGLEQWPQRLHLIAGPFGAGKTTTAVRMALALQKERPGIKICIINADAERGGGRLLLKHYAGLSDLCYHEAGSAADMAALFADSAGQGFEKIIMDLPGLGPGTRLREAAPLSTLGRDRTDQAALHIVCAPHYTQDMQMDILERCQLDLPASLIWGKLDEYGRYGAILNMAVASGLPVSCLSFGPSLLNTLTPAEQPLLWRLIFRHELPAREDGPAARCA